MLTSQPQALDALLPALGELACLAPKVFEARRSAISEVSCRPIAALLVDSLVGRSFQARRGELSQHCGCGI